MLGRKSSATVQQGTSIGKLNDVVSTTAFGTAILEHRTIHADVAELVDDKRQPLAVGLGDDVADQRGFTRSKNPVITVAGIRGCAMDLTFRNGTPRAPWAEHKGQSRPTLPLKSGAARQGGDAVTWPRRPAPSTISTM